MCNRVFFPTWFTRDQGGWLISNFYRFVSVCLGGLHEVLIGLICTINCLFKANSVMSHCSFLLFIFLEGARHATMGSKNKTDLLVPDWFCGGNSSLWEDDTDLQHVCHIDGLNSILQALFFIVFSLVLLLLKCCSHRQKWVTGYLQR